MKATHIGGYSDENMEKLINVTDINDIHIDEKLNEINRINFEGKEIDEALFIDNLEDAGFEESLLGFLLLEDGTFLLTEDSQKINLE